jgi:hypothetical protein
MSPSPVLLVLGHWARGDFFSAAELGFACRLDKTRMKSNAIIEILWGYLSHQANNTGLFGDQLCLKR